VKLFSEFRAVGEKELVAFIPFIRAKGKVRHSCCSLPEKNKYIFFLQVAFTKRQITLINSGAAT
jgi:hypothetical protein